VMVLAEPEPVPIARTEPWAEIAEEAIGAFQKQKGRSRKRR
jgi:hypothetical protein